MIVCRRRNGHCHHDSDELILINANSEDEAIKVLETQGLNPSDYTRPFTHTSPVCAVRSYGTKVCWTHEGGNEEYNVLA